MRYAFREARIALPWGILLLPIFFAILRLTKVVSPEEAGTWIGWVSFLEFVFPVLFPLFAFSLLDQEKRWRTLEVMVVTAKRKAAIFLMRYLLVLLPVVLAMMAAVRPKEYLVLLAPGLVLGGTALLFGLILGEETGLGLSLAWWGISFVIRVVRAELFGTSILSWFLLIQGGLPFSSTELMARKWVHFSLGLFLTALALAVADRKRAWPSR